MEIKTEVTLKQTELAVVPTTLVRELVFTGSHAVHHYAIISIIAKLQGLDIDEDFGVAPATASFKRDEIGCVR